MNMEFLIIAMLAILGAACPGRHQSWLSYAGGDGGTRTLDPLNAIEVLSQLSYIPTPLNIAEPAY